MRDSIHFTSHHLNNYQWEVSDLIHKFESFNIRSIPRLMNFESDMLASAASNLSPSDDFSHDKFSIELIYRRLILNNITNWRIFDDREPIINFLHSEDTFKGSIIDDEQHKALLQLLALENNPEYINVMTKNIIRLEILFGLQVQKTNQN